ncbi:hypothetical protein F5Y19DRAFT_435768 [Xylariaceae sp. FL1651]|nr:hypothetical protein F5Y19DRAFT_435768 [Xylariaceae sp. FL1651]
MADPLSIAGLAAGVISLGLQVAGGLSDYLNAVKGRTEELNLAKEQTDNMKDLLMTIKDLLPQVKSSWPESANIIERHVKSCNTELNALHTLLSELSEPSSSDSGIYFKIAEQKKKLIYPFNRSDINRIVKRLAKVNSALQIALQVTGLNVSITSVNQIRQIHDAVLSLSQFQVLQTQSTVARVSLTAASENPKRIAVRGVGVPLDSIETAMALASKPSLLSSSIAALEKCNTLPAACRGVSRACVCRTSRTTTCRRSSWGYFAFSYETSNTKKHLPSCPFSRIDGEMQATRFTVEYRGLRKLFQTAVGLSFVNTHGAGGRNISPGFAHYPIVDEHTAPAFRVITLAYTMLTFNFYSCDSEIVVKAVQCCYNTVLTLYSERKASPLDISSTGESLMHKIGRILSLCMFLYKHKSVTDALISMATKLHACGVPVATCDDNGFTPLGSLLYFCPNWEQNETAIMEFMEIILPGAPDALLVTSPTQRRPRYWRGFRMLLNDLKLAEASGCGPLSLAARASDERLVQDLVQRHPESLKEVNQFGMSPLHFSVYHPSCLRLILEASGLAMLDGSDGCGLTPLDYACLTGCRTSAQILLASGCRINPRCIHDAHASCTLDLLMALKQRRDELKLLALENLSEAEAKSFGLYENTALDGHAFAVQELLRNKGVHIPPRLFHFRPCPEGDQSFASLYHIWTGCPSTETLIKMWAVGFRDVNSFDRDGDIPLMIYCWRGRVVRWLIEHGADYWTPFCDRNERTRIKEQVTPAHFLLCSIGRKIQQQCGCNETRQWLVEKLLQVQVRDTCSCPCFVGGCTPFKAAFDWWRYGRGRPSPQRFAQLSVHWTQTLPISYKSEHLITSLRRTTFDALELKHSCCNFYSTVHDYRDTLHTVEEASEIKSEQSTLLALFVDLLSELEQVALEDRSGMPLIASDPEEFWMRCWLPRVTEVLDSLDGDDLTEDERSAAEAVGVVWAPRLAQSKNDSPAYTPEYVMKLLEKIMNE